MWHMKEAKVFKTHPKHDYTCNRVYHGHHLPTVHMFVIIVVTALDGNNFGRML